MPWHTVARTESLRDGYGMAVTAPGRRKPIALFRWAGEFYALGDECSHAYAPLSGGNVEEYVVRCPWHGAQFDIRTGKGVGDLAYPDLRTFPVRVVGDDVQVEV
jgi:3-phenylpropionate/trans-cinnamate dioxygenase ferredoxin subunit